MELVHGGDWAGFEQEYGGLPLDFSANISPLGVPEGVRLSITEAAMEADRYPDPLCRSVSSAIAAAEVCPAGFVLCGNGAADLLFRLALAKRPRRALIPAPAFAEYAAALRTVGCAVGRYNLREESGFLVDEGFPAAIRSGIDVVFLCEPNNPTGRTTPPELLHRILARCGEVGALLVVDECFGDFLDDPEAHTMRGQLAGHPNLLILKAFTKLYAMAGVRLGYCLSSDGALLDAMRRAGQPWAVSTLAQAAGIAALKETDYVARVRALIQQERPFLTDGLRKLGLRVIPGEANYLLFRSERPLAEPLRRRGILLRSCGNYPGLDESWYRTAVRTRAENERLLRALGEVLYDG